MSASLWDDAPDAESVGEPVRPPVGLAIAALAAVVASVALVRIDGYLTHGVGYAVGSFVTIGLVTAFKRADNRRRRSPWYSPDATGSRLAAVAALLGVVAAGAHVWWIATELAS